VQDLIDFSFLFGLAWVIAEMVCNAGGLGFNGYGEKGEAKWDLMTNVNIYNLEVQFFFWYTS
jgi:hypothetical protein